MMNHRRLFLSSILSATLGAAACDDNGAAKPARDDEGATGSGTLVFRGETYVLNEIVCGVTTGSNNRQWWGGNPDHDVDVRVIKGTDTYSVTIYYGPLGQPPRPKVSNNTVPAGVITSTDDSVSGTAEVTERGFVSDDTPAEEIDAIEFEMRC
jgi:hypothetical protein